MLQIVLEIRKLVLFSKLNVLNFRKIFLNTFYKLYLIRKNVLNTNNIILNSRYPIWIRLIFFTVQWSKFLQNSYSSPFVRIFSFIDLDTQYAYTISFCIDYVLWQYGLWSFQTEGTKIEDFLWESTYSKEIIEFCVLD